MAQDFAKRSRSRAKKPPPRRFSLGSFVLGIFTGVGLFLVGAYGPGMLSAQLSQTARSDNPAAGTTRPDSTTNGAAQEMLNQTEGADASSQLDPPDVEFVFRDLLGEDEVDPDLSAYESEILAAQKATPSYMPTALNYLLQSGSFQSKAEAESRMGTLLLLNLPASIVEARIDNNIWYRVIVGPYDQRSLAQQAVARLKANNIRSIWMERPAT